MYVYVDTSNIVSVLPNVHILVSIYDNLHLLLINIVNREWQVCCFMYHHEIIMKYLLFWSYST